MEEFKAGQLCWPVGLGVALSVCWSSINSTSKVICGHANFIVDDKRLLAQRAKIELTLAKRQAVPSQKEKSKRSDTVVCQTLLNDSQWKSTRRNKKLDYTTITDRQDDRLKGQKSSNRCS